MKTFPITFFLLVFAIFYSHANNTTYFQQRVNIYIEAELIDSTHQIKARQTIEYINNSPDTLHEIFIHMWANGWKNENTAFARQLIENRNYDFHFAPDNHRGGYSHIDFRTRGTILNWGTWQDHPDVGIIYPSTPVLPDDTLVIDINFTLDFPHARFSRLGHHKQAYYATQWYPKPAVYNQDGWNAFPYLHRGEFLGEFGDFNIHLTLPQNYIVASTGILQNEEEILFLRNHAIKTASKGPNQPDADTHPPSSTELKTLHFKQQNIHDFAWFADKRFKVLSDTLALNKTKKVEIFSYFTHQASQWFRANQYLSDIVTYMSAKLGDYPWGQISAVQGIHTQGAMEYPAITLIGQKNTDRQLERVLVHEAIHNWFYGILANNERKEPWIDEGFTTYYENRFFSEKYPDQKLLGNFSNSNLASFFRLSHINYNQLSYNWYILKGAMHLDQAPATESKSFSLANYYAMSYSKSAMSLNLLEQYLGAHNFDAIMKKYYRHWKFGHPTASDIENTFNHGTDKDIDWFFSGLIGSDKKADIAMVKARSITNGYSLTIKNRGDVNLPFPVSALSGDIAIKTLWYDGFVGKKELYFPGQNYDGFFIDQQGIVPEICRKNNFVATSGLWRRARIPSLQFMASIHDPQKPAIYWFPVMAYNVNDGYLPGLAFYNFVFPVAKTDVFFMPMYSTQRDALSGTAWYYRDIYPNSRDLHSIRTGLSLKSFGLSNGDMGRAYTQLKASIKVITTPALSGRNKETYFRYSGYIIHRDKLNYTSGNQQLTTEKYYVNQLKWVHDNQMTFNPYKAEIELLQSEQMLRTACTGKIFFPIRQQDKGLHLRFFAGAFLIQPKTGTGPDFRLGLQGRNPSRTALYDDIFIGYNQRPGTIFGNQTSDNQGAFKYPTPLGLTWDWLTALNVALDIPSLPLRVFFDTGTYSGASKEIIGTRVFPYVAGIQATIFKDVVNINFPVFVSDDIKRIAELNKLGGYHERITFSIDFDKINPMEARRKLHLILFQ
jgi:hypothetical protein